MKRLVFVSLLIVFAPSLQTNAGATNYHEYRKFDESCPTGEKLCGCPGNHKQRWNCCYLNQACRCIGGVLSCH